MRRKNLSWNVRERIYGQVTSLNRHSGSVGISSRDGEVGYKAADEAIESLSSRIGRYVTVVVEDGKIVEVLGHPRHTMPLVS